MPSGIFLPLDPNVNNLDKLAVSCPEKKLTTNRIDTVLYSVQIDNSFARRLNSMITSGTVKTENKTVTKEK